LPGIREQFVELLLWRRRYAGKQIAGMSEGIDKFRLATADQGPNHLRDLGN
jgi:hypothetical protein